MIKFSENRPYINKRSGGYIFFIIVFAILGISVVLLPVVVNFLNRFSTVAATSYVLYYVLRGIFGVSLAIGAGMFAVKKDTLCFSVPCLLGLITLLFPLYNSVYGFVEAMVIAKQLSMQMGYLTFLLDAIKYLVYTLLCLFTLLYTLGYFNYPTIITILSVLGTIGTVSLSLHTYMTYDITAYEVISVSDGAILCVLPLLLLFSTHIVKKKAKSKRYKARRMR